MLIVSFQISNIPQTIANNRKIELHDTIKGIIKNTMNGTLFVQIDTTLDFNICMPFATIIFFTHNFYFYFV